MAVPATSVQNLLNPSKGYPSISLLDYAAKVSANVQYDMRAGQTAHLNASFELEPGVQLSQMPLFLFQGANDNDVNGTGNDQWQPVTPTGTIQCFVATGGFELETTEYDAAHVYAANDPLRAPIGNGAGDSAVSGKLTNQGMGTLYGADMAARVGSVSGPIVKRYGKNVLPFWPVHIPGKV